MQFRKPTSRWAFWVFAAALLLKSAMPMLASASAEQQGKTLVEVCTVYGVAMVSLDGSAADHHVPAPDHASDHGSEHCALSAMGAFAMLDAPTMASAQVPIRSGASPPVARASSVVRDACASWVARLKHGPPNFA